VIGMHRLQQPIAQRLRGDGVVEAHDLTQQRQAKNSASVYLKVVGAIHRFPPRRSPSCSCKVPQYVVECHQ
jgi:hypothetical protein